MQEPKALLVADPYLQADRWEQMTKLAQSLVLSKALPRDVQNANQALVKMQYGLEIGLKPMQALSGTMIVNGAVNPWGKTVVYLLRQAGWKIAYEEEKDKCTAIVSKGDEEYRETLTFQEAVDSKWVYQYRKGQDGKAMKDRNGDFIRDLKVGWYEGANRKLKLRYGALSMIIKSYLPEVLGGASDIAEVAEDYIIVEETTPTETPATDPRSDVTTTPDQRQQGLKDFLESEKNKPKVSPITAKDIRPAPETSKNDEKTSKNNKNGVKTTNDQAEGGGADPNPNIKAETVVEGEVVAEGGNGKQE